MKMRRRKRRVAGDATRNEERQVRERQAQSLKSWEWNVCCLVTCFHAFASQILKTDPGCPETYFVAISGSTFTN